MAPAARREVREAYERLRRYFIVALQAGLAAGLAWYVAGTLLENPQPLFAPAAAVGTIAAAIGNRIRRTAELLGGVIVGVLVGDLLIKLIGAGPVQTGLVVALAISLAVVIRGSGAVMVQAGMAVLLGTVEPNAPDLAVPRTANALAARWRWWWWRCCCCR
ncbi:FUSC family protein [Micromonospora sp. BRA006-A]|nr:FUSC family protein [Micromonospora sp. BRA006-A]